MIRVTRVCVRSSHLSNKTLNVVEMGKAGDIKIKHAWVFHDDIFILLTHDKLLYMSVEVSILYNDVKDMSLNFTSIYRVFIIACMTLSPTMTGRCPL